MPKLDERLKCVARMIRASTHVDIGSDHGHLLYALIKAGRIQRGIAIEKKERPWANSRAVLAGLPVDVRLGDGLEPLVAGEADSLSICGLGGRLMVEILERFPGRVPPFIVLQPNRRPELVRGWAFRSGFHFVEEVIDPDHWNYRVMSFRRSSSNLDDPAYSGIDQEVALMFGPLVIRNQWELLKLQLVKDHDHLTGLEELNDDSAHRLSLIKRLLDLSDEGG